MSLGWHVFRDIIALQNLIRRWSLETLTFFSSWGESAVTLEDLERLFVLLSMGVLNAMELELSEEETKIKDKLYKAFRGCTTSPNDQRARFSAWILAFKKSGNHAVMRAAFLVMWLGKCIFNCDPVQHIKPFTFSLAIKLSQGMSLLLGALFLACLYSELDQLHHNELASSPIQIVDSGVNIVTLQAFAWECSRSYLSVGKA